MDTTLSKYPKTWSCPSLICRDIPFPTTPAPKGGVWFLTKGFAIDEAIRISSPKWISFMVLFPGLFSTLQVDFQLQRHMGYFLIQIYVPCTLIVIISWVNFWINREATADRVSLGQCHSLSLMSFSPVCFCRNLWEFWSWLYPQICTLAGTTSSISWSVWFSFMQEFVFKSQKYTAPVPGLRASKCSAERLNIVTEVAILFSQATLWAASGRKMVDHRHFSPFSLCTQNDLFQASRLFSRLQLWHWIPEGSCLVSPIPQLWTGLFWCATALLWLQCWNMLECTISPKSGTFPCQVTLSLIAFFFGELTTWRQIWINQAQNYEAD